MVAIHYLNALTNFLFIFNLFCICFAYLGLFCFILFCYFATLKCCVSCKIIVLLQRKKQAKRFLLHFSLFSLRTENKRQINVDQSVNNYSIPADLKCLFFFQKSSTTVKPAAGPPDLSSLFRLFTSLANPVMSSLPSRDCSKGFSNTGYCMNR